MMTSPLQVPWNVCVKLFPNTDGPQALARLADLSMSGLRFVEDEKEYGYGQGAKGVDERRKQRRRGDQPSHHIQQAENQIPDEKRRYQNRSDQRKKSRTFKRHARSMDVLSGGGNPLGGPCRERTASGERGCTINFLPSILAAKTGKKQTVFYISFGVAFETHE